MTILLLLAVLVLSMRNNDLTVRVNYYPYRDFGRKAEVFFMKKITRNICFIIFLLLPLMIHAEEQANYSSIVTDGVAAFVCTDDGRVFSCNNDQVDDTVPITVLDPEREHILIKDGQPVILQQDIQTLHILSVDRKPLVSVEMDSSLTWGTDDWSVRQPRILDNRLYFLFYVGVEENARLVRYDLNTKDYKVSQYSSVVAYQPLADGSAYMAVQGEDHTEIYQVFQEATLEQHLYNIDSYQTNLRMWQLKLQEQKKQLLASDNPSEQRDIQAEIDRLEERILNPDPELVYAVTEEEIQFYQHEIIPNIWYPYTNELVEQSQRNAWFRNLVEQFLNGHLEENMFVMQLEKRIRMMQMEGGII